MSNASSPPLNPYRTPSDVPSLKPRLPTFSLVMIILDLFFLAFQACALVLIVSMIIRRESGLMLLGGAVDLIVIMVMLMAGVPGDIGLLMRKPWGVYFAWVRVGGSLASTATSLFNMLYLSYPLLSEPAALPGLLIWGLGPAAIHLVLIGLYARAVWLCAKSFNQPATLAKA